MSSESPSAHSLRDQIWQAADPTGTQRMVMSAADSAETLTWIGAIGADVGQAWGDVRVLSSQYDALMRDIEGSLRTLVPRGWAVFNMNTDQVRRAVALVDAGKGTAADDLLAGQWGGESAWRTKRVCDRVDHMGATEPSFLALFRRRAALLRKAKKHHEAGRYEASIPSSMPRWRGS